MLPRLENIRAAIFAIVRKNSFSDDALQSIIANLGLDPDDARKVHEVMKSVRDACCEFNQFAPRVPEESKILVV
jgi:hypothetical protein